MKKFSRVILPLFLASALSLSGCSNDAKDTAENLGLQAGDQGRGNETVAPGEELPDPPIDSLTESQATPEAAAKAYMNFLQLGRGSDLCELFTSEALKSYYDSSTGICVKAVEEYADSVRYSFQDSLNVAENLTLKVSDRTDTSATVGIAVTVNQGEDVSYYDKLDLKKNGDKWEIQRAESLSPSDPVN